MSTVFYVMPQSVMLIPSSGSATVGGNPSELTGYEFSNVFDPASPWSKWRSSYSDANDHTLVLNYTGVANILVILGANFSSIKRSFLTFTLTEDVDTGTYKMYKSIANATDTVTLTIPAQSTGDGYFEAQTMFLTYPVSYATGLSRARYPYGIQHISNVKENTNESGQYFRRKKGDTINVFSCEMDQGNIAAVNTINAIKSEIGLHNYCLFIDSTRGWDNPYIVRRINDFSWTQRGVNSYAVPITFESVV